MTTAPNIAAPKKEEAWHRQSAEDVLGKLNSTPTGLSAQEAAKRLAADGPNELKEGKRISPFQIFLGQFKSLIIWILIAAGVLSGGLGEMVDAIAILAIVVLNAVIGFYQEFNAEKSIAALKKMTAPQAKVRRDGKVTSIPASGIVTGDILALEAGDLVAADARLLTAASLKCIESALTGESEAVNKQPATLEQSDIPLGDRENMMFMGTSITAGTGQAVVVATAMNTELGRIAGLIGAAGEEQGTPLQQKLDSFGRILVWAALGIVALLFGLGLLRGTKLFELTMTSVSLAVAAVPEGLPAVVTVSLALGVSRMSRRRALVRKLPAVETLGSTTVICTDKTGTLTVGEMTVRALYVSGQSYEVTGEGYGPDGEAHFEGKKVEAPHAALLLELATVLTGFLTAGVAFAVYMYALKTWNTETARTYAFAVLVFAELLRSLGARSETKPVWRISLFTNRNLLIVLAISFGLQVWSQHNAMLGRFLKTSSMPLTDCLLLLAMGTIPLMVLEGVKIVRNARRPPKTEP